MNNRFGLGGQERPPRQCLRKAETDGEYEV